jgi:oxalate decarboxylase/phosphoglucose isomerase-like protein (cupin superfamily)
MKYKEITLGLGYTYQPEAYHSIKGEAHITVSIEEGDDIDVVETLIQKETQLLLIANLAGVQMTHNDINKGRTPLQLLAAMAEDAEDGTFPNTDSDLFEVSPEEDDEDDQW